jgi:hypothetical protein
MYIYQDHFSPTWLTPEWNHFLEEEEIGAEPANFFVRTVDVKTQDGKDLVEWIQKNHIMKHLRGIDNLMNVRMPTYSTEHFYEATVIPYGPLTGVKWAGNGMLPPAEATWMASRNKVSQKAISKSDDASIASSIGDASDQKKSNQSKS